MYLSIKAVGYNDATEDNVQSFVNVLTRYSNNSNANYVKIDELKMYLIIGNENDIANYKALTDAAMIIQSKTA